MAIMNPAARGGRGVLERTFAAPLLGVEVREPNSVESGGDWYTIRGHAAVFESPTVLYKGAGFEITEEIARGAFDDVLASNPDVHLNINHDMAQVLARTGVRGVGQLDLSVDSVGLGMYARVSGNLSYANDLAELMRSGVLDQASFAFRIGEEEMTTRRDESGFETDHFRILRVSELFDVSVLAQGAYAQTDAVLHARMRAAGRAVESAGRDGGIEPSESVGPPGTTVIAPDDPAGAETKAAERRLAALRLKARVALAPYKGTIR